MAGGKVPINLRLDRVTVNRFRSLVGPATGQSMTTFLEQQIEKEFEKLNKKGVERQSECGLAAVKLSKSHILQG
jgi:hypothetical protein